MRHLVAVLVVILFLITLAPLALAEPSLEKIADIKKLLVVSGIQDQMGYMKDTLLNSIGSGIHAAYPKAPDEFWNEYHRLIGDKEMQELMARVIPVYDKHMSHEVVKKLIEMFETPFWEEWKNKMPAISREAGLIGSKWGQEIVGSDAFDKQIDALIAKYDLENLNTKKKD